MGIQQNIIIGQAFNILSNNNEKFMKALLSSNEESRDKARDLIRKLAKEIQYMQDTQADFLKV